MGFTAVKFELTCFILLLPSLVFGAAALYFWPKPPPPTLEIKITSGRNVPIDEFPFQLALEGGGRHICGGSILSVDWALTAAHCIYDEPVKWLAFRAGSSFRQKGGTLHPVKYYVHHENYTGNKEDNYDYDVAVVFVKTPFVFSNTALPVILPMQRYDGGGRAVATGWGYLQDEKLSKSSQLQAADLEAYDWKTCSEHYPGQFTERMMCAGDPDHKKDTCQGDSGGPLTISKSRVQVGIVSWGYKCADIRPSVFTNVSAVASWIRKTVGFDDPLIFSD